MINDRIGSLLKHTELKCKGVVVVAVVDKRLEKRVVSIFTENGTGGIGWK